MRFNRIAILFAALASSGCATKVFSSSASSSAGGSGVAYALPRALIPVRVIAMGPDISLDVGQPIYGPDPGARYVLNYRPNSANSDTVKVTVDPKSGFISSINTTVTGDLDTAIVNAAKSAAALTAESQPTKDLKKSEVLLIDMVVDPADIQTAQTTFNSNLRTALSTYRPQGIATCRKAAADARKAKEEEEKKAAEAAAKTKTPAKPPPKGAKPAPAPTAAQLEDKERVECETSFTGLASPQVSISLRDAIPTFTSNAALCSQGVCHRAAADNVIIVTLNGRTISRGVRLPNGQPVNVIALDRPWFADGWKTDIAFEDGYVKSVDIDHKSDVAAGFLLPANAVGGFINGLGASLIGVKKTKLEQENLLLDAQLASVKKKKDLADEIEKNDKAKAKEDDVPKAESDPVAPGAWYPILISVSSTGEIRRSYIPLDNGAPQPAAGQQPVEQTGNDIDGNKQTASNEGTGTGAAETPAPAPKTTAPKTTAPKE